MPRFDFKKLVVLHLYNYIRPRGVKDPLEQVEKECQVVKLSTCMRTIYVLNSEALSSEAQQEAYKALVTFIEKRDMYSGSTRFEKLEGAEAYEFLLYWILGGVNPKSTFHDSRILGDVRAIWSKMSISTSPRVKHLTEVYRSFFNDLFTDSVNLNKLIPSYEHLELIEMKKILKRACSNCSWARVNEFLVYLSGFNYINFSEDTHIEELETLINYTERKLVQKSEFLNRLGIGLFATPELDIQITGIRLRLIQMEQLYAVLRLKKAELTASTDDAKSALTCSNEIGLRLAATGGYLIKGEGEVTVDSDATLLSSYSEPVKAMITSEDEDELFEETPYTSRIHD